MIAAYLQEALIKDVKEILKDVITENASGGRVSGVNVFAQQLPIIRANEKDPTRS